jgi:competence protein ComEA
MLKRLLSVLALGVLIGGSVPVAAQTKSSPKPTTARSTAAVNINTASATELTNLPGVGAKMAARIIEYRQKNGPFKKPEDLMNVRGIGEKNFLKLKPQILVGTAARAE